MELESADKDSVLNFYKAMIQLRNHSEYTQTLIYGDLEDVETDSTGIIVFRLSVHVELEQMQKAQTDRYMLLST